MTCGFDGCEHAAKARGLCQAHYQQQRLNKPLTALVKRRGRVRRAPGTPSPRVKTSSGYYDVYFPEHPNAGVNGRVLEHVMIMTDVLGRALVSGENVHHKNGDRTDNRPSNLELWVTTQPAGQRIEDKVEWAKEILARYEPGALA